MKTVPSHQPNDHDGSRVVITGLVTSGGYFAAVGLLLESPGASHLMDSTIRYIATVGGCVLFVALFVAATYLRPCFAAAVHRRRHSRHKQRQWPEMI